jgi:hypothetical protein
MPTGATRSILVGYPSCTQQGAFSCLKVRMLGAARKRPQAALVPLVGELRGRLMVFRGLPLVLSRLLLAAFHRQARKNEGFSVGRVV